MAKVLIIYFSYEGHTKAIALRIASCLDADLVEVKVPGLPRAKGFMKYLRLGFMAATGKSPVIEAPAVDLDYYSTIVIGSPVWAGKFNPALRTYFKDKNLAGKKVGAFFSAMSVSGPQTASASLAKSLGVAGFAATAGFQTGKDSDYDVDHKIREFVAGLA